MAVIAAVILRDDEETPIGPPPTATAPADGWTPERTRSRCARRPARRFLQPSPSGLDAELYCVAKATPTGSPCPLLYPYEGPVEGWHWALEVTQGGQSALFEVRGTPIVTHFDDDSLLVHDGTTREARFRLLDADGSAVPLRLVSDLAPAVPGPEVVLIEDLDVWRHGSIGPDDPHPRPYLVDDSVGTLQPLDVPKEVLWWASNFDEFLLGRQRRLPGHLAAARWHVRPPRHRLPRG